MPSPQIRFPNHLIMSSLDLPKRNLDHTMTRDYVPGVGRTVQ